MGTRTEPCSFCNGMGSKTCMMCGGTGQRSPGISGFSETVSPPKICTSCGGTGQRRCMACGGTGYRTIPTIDFGPSVGGFSPPFKGADDAGWKPIRTNPPDWPTRSIRPPPLIRTSMGGHRPAPSSPWRGITGWPFLILLIAVGLGIWQFGIERVLVAAEGFFIAAGFFGKSVANWLRKQESPWAEKGRAVVSTGFGICAGLLVGYIVLTTAEGQAITQWVTAQTTRIVGSLFVSLLAPFALEGLVQGLIGLASRMLEPPSNQAS